MPHVLSDSIAGRADALRCASMCPGQWVLQARTWGHPARENVHEWQVLAAGAARLLDPAVIFPDRPTAVSPDYPMRPVGRAANKRSARIGRRILGL